VERIPEKTSAGTTVQGQHTILIVEDEPLMLRLLESFFSQHGYHVLVAADGEQAIELYRCYKRRIEAVLLDVRVPKITGEEVFRRMKKENAAVKVVIASGFLEANIKDQIAFAGVKRFVNKPYVLDELLEVFQNVIEND
jgi:two-component system, cell cycle sensor histidine kinase and response regulator CckA